MELNKKEEQNIDNTKSNNNIERFWIFSHYLDEVPVLEIGTPYEDRAKQRVKELKDWYGYTKAFYSNELPKKYFH